MGLLRYIEINLFIWFYLWTVDRTVDARSFLIYIEDHRQNKRTSVVVRTVLITLQLQSVREKSASMAEVIRSSFTTVMLKHHTPKPTRFMDPNPVHTTVSSPVGRRHYSKNMFLFSLCEKNFEHLSLFQSTVAILCWCDGVRRLEWERWEGVVFLAEPMLSQIGLLWQLWPSSSMEGNSWTISP